jgi:prepilin-type N-terminal cleavage/methylation domain-containing protein
MTERPAGRSIAGTGSGGRPPAGFTLVEVLVTVFVLAILATGAMILYRQSIGSYRLTTWKQERTRQAELFWNRLRKPLEEATDKLERQDLATPGNWTITRTSRPLLFNPSPTADGTFMAWQIDHFDPASGLVTGPDTWLLARAGREIRLTGPGVASLLVLEDVATITIRSSQVTQRDATFEEELDGPGRIVGSILEISILLKPPPSIGNPEITIVQNAKFKLVVESKPTANPSY